MDDRSVRTRRGWLASCLGVTAGIAGLAGCMNTDKSNTNGNGTSDELPASEWPMYGVDPQNTGYHPTATGPTGDDVERKTFYEAEEAVSSSLAIIGETLYTATDDSLSAVDLTTGEQEWQTKVAGLRGYYPAIDGEKVYVGTNDGIAAVDRNRAELSWRKDIGISTVRPVVAADAVIGAENMILYSFDPETGTETILHDLRDYEGGRPYTNIPAYDDGTIYFAGGHVLYAVDAESGEVKWKFKNPEEEPMGESNPAVSDGTVYIGGEDQRLYAISTENGDEEWSINTKGETPASPSIANGIVYVMTSGTVLTGGDILLLAIGIDEGDILWEKILNSYMDEKPMVADDTVYHTNGKQISAYDGQTGDIQWKINEFDDYISGPPTICGDTLFISVDNGAIYTIRDI